MLRSKRPFRVIFEGQSLNNFPTDGGDILGHGYPWHTMKGLGIPYNIPAVSGVPFYEPTWGDTHDRGDLYSDLSTRVLPLIGRDEKTIVILCGGTSDTWSNNSGEQMYDDHVRHANAMYDAGADHVITTTICKSNNMTTEMNAQRTICNNLLLLNEDLIFTNVANLMDTDLETTHDVDPVTPGYQNPYYFDGIHFYDPGARIVAGEVRPYVLTLIRHEWPWSSWGI